MICDECGNNSAIFSVTISSGGEITNKHLCADCMKKMEASFSQGNVHGFLSSILSMLSTNQTDSKPVCSHCGLRYSDFERTGKLGCAGCYQDFQKELSPMLQRIHGCTQHIGRIPDDFHPSQQTNDEPSTESENENAQELLTSQAVERQLEALRQKMEEAVAVENFEAAAQYRDEIRAIMQDKEVGQA